LTPTAILGFFVFPAALFVLAYGPAVTQLSRAVVSPYPKADLKKRLYAATTDSLLVATTGLLYQSQGLLSFLIVGALYLLLRDAVRGQSLGKLLFGLVVISLETGRPAGLGSSVRRNLVLLLPGANVAALFLEVITLARDVQGQRLGDRLAQTQVVEGLGAKDLVGALQRWWQAVVLESARAGGRGRRVRPLTIDASWSELRILGFEFPIPNP
jgi:uncharacterized RDD family membrane protein YckC